VAIQNRQEHSFSSKMWKEEITRENLVVWQNQELYKQWLVVKKKLFWWEICLEDRFIGTSISPFIHMFGRAMTKREAIERAEEIMKRHPKGWAIENGAKV